MVNKAVKVIAKKSGSKALEKISDSYGKFNKSIFGIRPLNVGERETVQCLQNPHNSLERCKSLGDKARIKYQKTGKYK